MVNLVRIHIQFGDEEIEFVVEPEHYIVTQRKDAMYGLLDTTVNITNAKFVSELRHG